MSDKLLFIILEGSDDKRFFEKVGKLVFQNKYYLIKFWEYSQQKKKINENFISSVNSMNADYICFGDFNNAPCVTAAKGKVNSKFNNIISDDNIIVVFKEIESWYLAGLDKSACIKLGIRRDIVNTNNITKRHFKTLIPSNFNSIKNFMLEILKCFSIKIAKKKNKSFKYFIEKYNC